MNTCSHVLWMDLEASSHPKHEAANFASPLNLEANFYVFAIWDTCGERDGFKTFSLTFWKQSLQFNETVSPLMKKNTEKKISLCLVIPVYNEEDAIGSVLDEWCSTLSDLSINYNILCYNDGSKDNSAEVLNKMSAARPQQIIATNKANEGHGPTILRGYREGAKIADWIFQIDSDNEMGTASFKSLWEQRDGYDFLLGRRDGRAQPLARKLISFVSRMVVRVFYGKSVWDVNAPYRLMRSTAFENLFQAIPSDTFAPNVIVSGYVGKKKLKFKEIEVSHQDRQTGEVSIKKWKLLKAAARSFRQTISFSFNKL